MLQYLRTHRIVFTLKSFPMNRSLPSFAFCLLLVLFSVTTIPALAQNNLAEHYCASDLATEKLFLDNPAFRIKQETIESQLFQLLNGVPLSNVGSGRQVYTIPVVVHI